MTSHGVRRFDPETQLEPGASILIIGMRRSGKTYLLYDLFSYMEGWFRYGVLYTPTGSTQQLFKSCIPKTMIYRHGVERLQSFIRFVEGRHDAALEEGRRPDETFLICDDTAFDDKFMGCTALGDIFLNGRHKGLTLALNLQYFKKVGPALRGNADLVFIYYDPENEDEIYKTWFRGMDKKTFKEIYKECTQGYGCLVMDAARRARSRNWHDYVYWYEAAHVDDIPAYRLVHDDFFALNDKGTRKPETSETKRIIRLGPEGKIMPGF